MMAIGLIGGLASGVVGMMAAQQQADAQEQAANYNAQIQDYNKKVAERNAANALHMGELDAMDKRVENRRTMGAIRAAYGASGLDLEGSPLEVMNDTALEQEFDVAKTVYKSKVTAVGYKDNAENYAAQGNLYRMQAASAKRAGGISALSALVGGLGSAGKAGFSMAQG